LLLQERENSQGSETSFQQDKKDQKKKLLLLSLQELENSQGSETSYQQDKKDLSAEELEEAFEG